MVSIAESMRGLNGDGWGTTMTAAEQRAHQEYVKKNFGGGLNAAYERDREREMEEMRLGMGLKPEFDREADLTSMKTSFIDGFLQDPKDPKDKPTVDMDFINKLIDGIKSKHSEDLKNLSKQIDAMSGRIKELEDKVTELTQQVSKPGFFKRIANWFSCLGR
jgi:hypothetical protein